MSHLSDKEREDLVAYLDGELDEETAQALEAKINLDPEARREVEALRQAWGMLDHIPGPQPSTSFTHRTLERLSLEKMEAARRSRLLGGRRLRGLGWAAAFLLLAGTGYGAARVLWSQPREDPEHEEALIRYLGVVEKWHLFEQAPELEVLRALEEADLFEEEPGP